MVSDATKVWGDEETQFFTSLGPEQVLKASERFGISCTGRVLQLNSMENRVFQLEVETEDELAVQDPRRYRVVKFYRPGRWSFDQIMDEHRFLQELSSEEYPVVAPVEVDGESILTDEETGLFVSLFPRVGGRNVDEIRDSHIQIVGRLLARMHVIGARTESRHRLRLDCSTYGDQNLDLITSLGVLPYQIEDSFVDLVEDILDLIEPMLENVPYQRVHGDCHLGNLLEGDKGLFWVDFDDTVMAPPIQDVWLVEPGRDDYALRRREALLLAYETFKPFDYGTLKLIEPLRTLRILHFIAWTAKRWDDPAFKKAFPDFGTDQYWAEQMETLEEQAELISEL